MKMCCSSPSFPSFLLVLLSMVLLEKEWELLNVACPGDIHGDDTTDQSFVGERKGDSPIIGSSDSGIRLSEREAKMIARISGVFKQLGYKPSCTFGANFFSSLGM